MSNEPSILSGAFEKMQKEAADNYRRWEELEKWLDELVKENEEFNDSSYDQGLLTGLQMVQRKVQSLGPVKKKP